MTQKRSISLTFALISFFTVGAIAQNRPNSETASTAIPRTLPTSQPVSSVPVTADYSTVSTMNRVGVQTAQPLSLTLDEAIRRALANNNDIEVARTTERIQETQIRQLLGAYDPTFTVTPVSSHSQSTGSSGTNDLRVSSNFSGVIQPGGGNYQAFFNNNRTESAFAQSQTSSGTITTTGALYSSSLGVQYTQPLARNFHIDSRRQGLRIARKRLEQNDNDFRLQAARTISSVQSAYWDLVFALRNQQNVQANVNLAKENLRQIEAKIEAGAAAPLERASIDTELANREGDLLSATQQVSSAENALKQLVLKDPLSAEWQQSFVPVDKPVFSQDATNLEAAMKDAMDNRFELKRLKLQTEINQIDQQYFRNQTKPQIDLNTQFSLNGLARGGTNSAFTTNLYSSVGDLRLFDGINQIRSLPSINLPSLSNDVFTIPASPSFLLGGFNRSLANIFRSDAPNFSIGVTISFPLRNRAAKAAFEGAKIIGEQIAAQTRAQEQQVIVDVRNAVQAVETSRQRVLTARRAREAAELQLDGERKLYDAGRSTTFLLFQRENTLTNARNSEIRAETDYNKSLAGLQQVTATSFKVNRITVDSPVVIK